ncbi:MAG: IS110 family transposase, partial [Cyclobacteriaceae bacterium]
QGKAKMAVLNAVRNKIIHRVFACVRDDRKYEKIYGYPLA